MKGIFLGQGFAINSGTEITFEELKDGMVAVWDKTHKDLLYILQKHFVRGE